jgi:type II secretory pathway pseudopilin PulG
MEIMVVVAIIVILAGVSVVAVTRYIEQARVDATIAKLKTIETAVTDYHNRAHAYPQNLLELTEPEGGLPAYLNKSAIVDEWGNQFVLDIGQSSKTGRPLIYSTGPNPGDSTSMIRNWQVGE